MSTNICPKSYLLESILITMFCCMPFGVVGIVKASSVSSAYSTGNYEEAQRLSAEAAKWVKYGLLGGAVYYFFVIIYCVVIMSASFALS